MGILDIAGFALLLAFIFNRRIGVRRSTISLTIAFVEAMKVLWYLRHGNHFSAGFSIFATAWFLWLWWTSGGDDDFKRGKKKLTEKVTTLINGRLGVQPA